MDLNREKYTSIPVFKARVNREVMRGFFDAVLGQSEDDLEPLEHGMRFSPKSIRTLIDMCSGTILDGDRNLTYQVPNVAQFSNNLLNYGYWLGMVSKLERTLVQEGVPLIRNLALNKSDVFISKTPERSSSILRSVESLAAYLDWSPAFRDKVKILFHGKWNVPNVGYFLWIEEVMNKVGNQFGVDREKILPIIVCERNKYISSVGSKPFMSTAWRASLMSFPPFNGVVVPGGDIEIQNADDYWKIAYRLLKPDIIPIEEGDEFDKQKREKAEQVGAKVLDIPSILPGFTSRISSSKLMTADAIGDEIFKHEYRTFEKRLSGEWKRRWF